MDGEPATQRFCDIVMKGGVTSGVVYPLAIAKLAEKFQLRNIGGTSAGAIAAAAAAAAEYGRQRGGPGFTLLKELPAMLGERCPKRSRLFLFFQPQKGTNDLFDIVAVALSGGGWAQVVAACIRGFASWFMSGLLGGILLHWVINTIAFDHPLNWESFGRCIVPGGLLGLFVGTAAMVVGMCMVACKAIPENNYGLCSGMNGQTSARELALTPWLIQYFNKLAGRADGDAPFTFGDLWGVQDCTSERNINLEMMTTCLSHGRPYRLPFRDDHEVRESRRFYFSKEDFLALFPCDVVAWMIHHPPAMPMRREDQERRENARKLGLYPLPDPWNLPVIVAVRMSLSFPILLSAVPLYAVDYSRSKEHQVLEKCWFSDGGISSNIPVHFFDSPLPRWPTFALNLTEEHPDREVDAYLPADNGGGLTEQWRRFDWGTGRGRIAGFLGAIFNSMQNWRDNTQMRMPGFRDRIAGISLRKAEGGLNLDMKGEVIEALAKRGEKAAEMFNERFGNSSTTQALSWENHRWVRLRSLLTSVEEMLAKVNRGCGVSPNGGIPYPVWIAATATNPPPGYGWAPWNNPIVAGKQRQLADDVLAMLLNCQAHIATAVAAGTEPLSERAPRPSVELRPQPRI